MAEQRIEERVARLEATHEHLATKADLESVRAELKAENGNLRAEIASLRGEFHSFRWMIGIGMSGLGILITVLRFVG